MAFKISIYMKIYLKVLVAGQFLLVVGLFEPIYSL